ncbi:MAG: hypothetical protein DRG78_05810 [Epsilonproteobacteria bacterium]|nr:MAG: hypothetical protein DRG78_05810 [Campylobacterota bacterium]
MIRDCFICSSKIESNVNIWNIPNIKGKRDIGFGYCELCKLVIQTPTIIPEEMFYYYENTATYINPGREGKPEIRKIDDVKRQLDFLQNIIDPSNISSAFQVGCSDGYTLSQVKSLGIDYINGIDPSINSNKLAKDLYNIETEIGVFENFNTSKKYDLIILTHLLEHIYNPNDTLEKCNYILNDNGHILIEVPLFENSTKFPIGMFTLEHLNYFTEESLQKLFRLNNLEILAIEKLYSNNLYPVITMVLKRNNHTKNFESSFKGAFEEYTNREIKLWANINQHIKDSTLLNENIYIWGAGIHTTQLLAYTNISKDLNIIGILDSSETKHNKKIGDFTILKPTKDIIEDKIIVISSYASEKEINNYIKNNFKYKKIILLYEGKD